jgi:hypothetical protein
MKERLELKKKISRKATTLCHPWQRVNEDQKKIEAEKFLLRGRSLWWHDIQKSKSNTESLGAGNSFLSQADTVTRKLDGFKGWGRNWVN